MEMELKDIDGGAHLTAETDEPLIRYYNVPKVPCPGEALLAAERKTRWKPVRPGGCGDISGVAFHFARMLRAELNVPVGIVDCYWCGTPIACWLDEAALRSTVAGKALLKAYLDSVVGLTRAEYEEAEKAYNEVMERWNARVEALRAQVPPTDLAQVGHQVGPCPWNPPRGPESPFRPAGLAYTMVKRAAPYTLTGILYYQGETDADVALGDRYQALMTSLIGFWRDLFRNDALPFLFVQLPVYKSAFKPENRLWAPLREAQERTYRTVRRTGMAVTIDYGEAYNVHPSDKITVAQRLFRQALKVVYGRASEPESPRALTLYREDETLVIALSAPVRSNGDPAWFEIAGADGAFRPAHATFRDGSLRLRADGVREPVQARYAWFNYCEVNVFGVNGLPLAPFRLAL